MVRFLPKLFPKKESFPIMHVCLGSKVLIAEGFHRPGPNNGLKFNCCHSHLVTMIIVVIVTL